MLHQYRHKSLAIMRTLHGACGNAASHPATGAKGQPIRARYMPTERQPCSNTMALPTMQPHLAHEPSRVAAQAQPRRNAWTFLMIVVLRVIRCPERSHRWRPECPLSDARVKLNSKPDLRPRQGAVAANSSEQARPATPKPPRASHRWHGTLDSRASCSTHGSMVDHLPFEIWGFWRVFVDFSRICFAIWLNMMLTKRCRWRPYERFTNFVEVTLIT